MAVQKHFLNTVTNNNHRLVDQSELCFLFDLTRETGAIDRI